MSCYESYTRTVQKKRKDFEESMIDNKITATLNSAMLTSSARWLNFPSGLLANRLTVNRQKAFIHTLKYSYLRAGTEPVGLRD